MSITLYDVIYLITQILCAYSVYKFLSAFFDEYKTHKAMRFISFSIYYILIAIVYFYFNTPVVNLIFNVSAFFALSFNFKGNLKKRVFSVLLTYLITFCCELIVVTLTGYIHFEVNSKNNFDSIFGVIGINLLLFTVAMILNRFKGAKKNTVIPKFYWFAIIIIPVSTLIVTFAVLTNEVLTKAQILINISLLLLINFFTFYLYDKMSENADNERKRQLVSQQNAYYEKQLEIMSTSLKATRSIRHDFKNHLASIYTLMDGGNLDDAKRHIESMFNVYKYNNSFFSGNWAIDSIINFKLQEAQQLGIFIEIESNIPSDIKLKSFDAAVILGNLFDNAFEAVKDMKDERIIKCDMKYNKGMLIIIISNPYTGTLIKKGDTYVTTKPKKGSHGVGIGNVKKAAEEYAGSLEINDKNNVFEAIATLYV